MCSILDGSKMVCNFNTLFSALTYLLLFQTSIAVPSITTVNTYSGNAPPRNKAAEIVKTAKEISLPSSSNLSGISSRNDKVGNVIFSDNFALGSTSQTTDDSGKGNKRKYRTSIAFAGDDERTQNTVAFTAGGFLQNHRLESSLSPEIASSSAAAATAALNFNDGNDLKISGDTSYNNNIHLPTAGVSGIGAGASVSGHVGYGGRSYSPQHQYGWASNPGSCLFSCSSGSFGATGTPSCCQLNYIQCCPNPRQEQWNFKNLHHGRGHFTAGGVAAANGFGKSGGWGSIPYNPPPIIRPKPCYPYQHTPGFIGQPQPFPIPNAGFGGGSIFHKGIESIKHNFHNIGQLFKGNNGGGWAAGGNGAAGYYFHRRSDTSDSALFDKAEIIHDRELPSNKKRRPTRSLNKGLDQFMCPIPVYSPPPNYGWAGARPHSVGLGSLIGWTRPPNHIHTGFIGGGNVGPGPTPVYPQTLGFGYNQGWGNTGPQYCKWDYDCSGNLKCCKGVCQLAPYVG